MIQSILKFFEAKAFGVCSWWGEKLGISSQRIRLTFIYVSFLTAGSPLLLYMVMNFILEHKDFFKKYSTRKTIWDL